MTNYLTIKGKIKFDPIDKTNKHKDQAKWKKMAMIVFDENNSFIDNGFDKDLNIIKKYIGITNYYAWFINNQYGLKLNAPLRNAHISFINDSVGFESK